MIKLAIITTHPIQYYAPVFKLMYEQKQIEIKVFYTLGEATLKNYDVGFGQKINWDIPLLEAYPFELVLNTSRNPGNHRFNGIVNPGLINQINLWNPDAVLILGWAYNSHLRAIRYFKNKIPVLFRGDSTLLDEKHGIRSILKSVFLKWLYKHIDYAFYNGTKNKAYFKAYGIKDRQLVFSPHAVDNKRFATPRTQEVALLKQSLNLTSNDLLVLFAGKLEEKKDPALLLDAIIAINDPRVHLLIVGNGYLENTLKSKALSYQNIHFLGFKNQSYMPVVYQACDLFCLPSKGPGESWGLAVNEAMACSKAILISDKCGCANDLVHDGENGMVFKNGSLSDLITSLKKLTGNKNILLNYGEVSGSIIKSWNFEEVVKTIHVVIYEKR